MEREDNMCVCKTQKQSQIVEQRTREEKIDIPNRPKNS